MFSVKKISKSFEKQLILDQLSFDLKAGEVLGILGESGSGKSTLLRIMAGILDPDDGDVFLNHKRILRASEHLIPGHDAIKIVHQEYQLTAVLSVRENIAYALRFYEKPYQEIRINELLELCHLTEIAHKPVRFLSGGEKQRTAIGRALAENAKVLLLDEPFAHLDNANKSRLRDFLKKVIRQTNVSCVFVTHESSEALSLSDKIGILENARLVQLDSPENVYKKPHNRYVAELTGECNILKNNITRPENYILTNTETPNAEVINNDFLGSRYLITVLFQKQKIKVYSSQNYETGKLLTLVKNEF
jgi:ABC-type Fe3+/spermidine/putrescine transport system ATPase subunit